MAVGKCSCSNVYMDVEYGKGMRVCNPINKSSNSGTGGPMRYRCCSCKAEIERSLVKGKK